MLAAAIGVDRAVEADVGRAVAGEDRSCGCSIVTVVRRGATPSSASTWSSQSPSTTRSFRLKRVGVALRVAPRALDRTRPAWRECYAITRTNQEHLVSRRGASSRSIAAVPLASKPAEIHASAASSPAGSIRYKRFAALALDRAPVPPLRAPANAWSAPGARSACPSPALAIDRGAPSPSRSTSRSRVGSPSAANSRDAGSALRHSAQIFDLDRPSLRCSSEARSRAAARAGRRSPIRRSAAGFRRLRAASRNSTRVRGAVSGSSGTSAPGVHSKARRLGASTAVTHASHG